MVRDYGVPRGKGAWLTESAMRKLEINPEKPVFPESNAWVIEDMPIAGVIEDVPFTSALHLDTDVTGIVILGDMDPDYAYYVARFPSLFRSHNMYSSLPDREQTAESQ